MLASDVTTIAQLFLRRVATTPDREAYREKKDGYWVSTTWRGFGDRIEQVAAGLAELGVSRGDTVAIVGACRPEWCVADMAAVLIGARTVGIYETLLVDQVEYLLRDSGAKVLFAQGAEQQAKVAPLLETIPSFEHLVVWDCDGEHTLNGLQERGAELLKEDPRRVAKLAEAVTPEDVAVVVYTSGTTGNPKGVPLSHGTIVSWLGNTQGMLMDEIGGEDITVSFLPLAHVAEHVAGFFGRMNLGLRTAYATSYETLIDELQEVRPTYFGAVPRIFEKMYGRIRERVALVNKRRQRIFWGAAGLARRRARAELGGPPLSFKDRMLLPLADRFVYRKIRDVFGGQVKSFITGAAPIELEILEFFYGVGMKIHEVYGLSESCAIAFANTEQATRLGTVGKLIPGVECRLDSDGEILLRGPSIFSGYLNLDSPEELAASFDADGFFRTGDIGEIDADGFLRITDRKKNLIKTAGGKYVVPARLEMLVKGEPIVGQVYVHGDMKPFVVALITLDERETGPLAKELGVPEDEVFKHPEVARRIDAAVQRANQKLARFEQIKRHAILPRDFSLEEGTLTATMKIKRRAVAETYSAEIEQLYMAATAAHQKAGATS